MNMCCCVSSFAFCAVVRKCDRAPSRCPGDLQACRQWCLVESSPQHSAEQCIMALAAPSSLAPLDARNQLMLELLDVILVRPDLSPVIRAWPCTGDLRWAMCASQANTVVERAMQLLGVLVASWESDDAGFAEDSVTGISPSSAVQSLPYTLPALLKSAAWRLHRPPICARLCKLSAPSSGDSTVQAIAISCVLALRDYAPPESWDAISRHLVCATL